MVCMDAERNETRTPMVISAETYISFMNNALYIRRNA